MNAAHFKLLFVVSLLAPMSGGCAKILGIQSTEERPFEHRAHVLKGINCLVCHRGMTEAGDTGPLHFPSTADCVACHTRPHNKNACSNCHGTAHIRRQAEAAREHLVFSHRAHTKEDGQCVTCHMGVQYERTALLPTMARCFGCHTHQEQWDVRDCRSCHVDLANEGEPPLSHVVHDGDFLREHGVQAAASRDLCASCHSERQCAACHATNLAVLPSRLDFASPTRTAIHRAGFVSRHSLEARADAALCVTCHSESSCQDCHNRQNIAATGPMNVRSPHPPDWTGPPGSPNRHGRAARLDPLTCASCHGGAGEALCVGCHSVGGPGGSPHPPGFSSRLGFSEMPCRLCHTEGR